MYSESKEMNRGLKMCHVLLLFGKGITHVLQNNFTGIWYSTSGAIVKNMGKYVACIDCKLMI